MKFAAALRSSSEEVPELADLSVLYKDLKKLLKRIPKVPGPAPLAAAPAAEPGAGPAEGRAEGEADQGGEAAKRLRRLVEEREAEFVRAFSEDVALLNESFLEREEENVIKLGLLEAQAADAAQPCELRAVYRDFVDFHGELLLLLNWSSMAFTGLMKILKKHLKRTGLPLQAPHLEHLQESQPFCSVEVTHGMVQRAEALVRSLEARLHAAPAADPAAEAADKEGGEAADAAAAAAPQPAAAACEGSSAALEQPPALGALSEEYDDDYSSSGEEATPSSRPPQGLAAAFLGHKRRAASAGLEVSDVVKRTRAALRLWRQLQTTSHTPSTVLPAEGAPAAQPPNAGAARPQQSLHSHSTQMQPAGM